MKILISLIIALFSLSLFAGITADQEYILNTQMGPAAHKTQMGTLIQRNRNLLVGKYSFAVQGGTSSASLQPIYLLTDLNNKKSFATIPKGAIITSVWINSLTSPYKLVSPGLYGTGNVSLGMSVLVANDLLNATEGSTGFLQILQGKPVQGTSTTWVKIPSTGTDKQVSISISNNPISAGKFNAYIEYVLGD